MRRNSEYVMRKIAGETILVPVGEASKSFNGMITMNETAAFIWENIDLYTPEELINKVYEEFDDCDYEEVKKDVQGVLLSLYNEGMIFID